MSHLRLDLSAVVPDGERFTRRWVLEELEERLPRDPKVKVGMYLGGIRAGEAIDWHVHNGAVYFLVVQGLVTLQYEHGEERYEPGQAYSEPIGQIHRAVNPHPSVEAVLVGFVATAADRPHHVNVGAPEWYRGD